jgi:GAF domain-containing protein
MTGQPMAVSQVTNDPRFNREVAEQSGYIPDSILAVPLVSEDHVFGVIEVLDKVSGESFQMKDIELLSLLADQAAVALTQAKQFEQLQAILIAGLKELALGEEESEPQLLMAALDNQPSSSVELIRLAEMIKEVSALGENERDACHKILRVFQEYSAARPEAGFGFGSGSLRRKTP